MCWKTRGHSVVIRLRLASVLCVGFCFFFVCFLTVNQSFQSCSQSPMARSMLVGVDGGNKSPRQQLTNPPREEQSNRETKATTKWHNVLANSCRLIMILRKDHLQKPFYEFTSRSVRLPGSHFVVKCNKLLI